MNKRILCVDDEVNVLDAFRRTLRRDFEISVAAGGEEALAMIAESEPFAVVMSDMRMPGMNGLEFLSRVKVQTPDSARIMLTGNSDQQTAVDAVNQGNIFRFLTKPCLPEALIAALNEGCERYRLLTVEKDLLEQTLSQSLRVLLDILAIVNPTAFNRTGSIRKLARHMADHRGVEKAWEVEFAAMLSQIGCVSVPEEILSKVVSGSPLSNQETGLYHRHPSIGRELIGRIPRLENVSEMIGLQNDRFDTSAQSTDVTVGAAILRAALDYDRLLLRGMSSVTAIASMTDRSENYDPAAILSLKACVDASPSADVVVRDLTVGELAPGMYLQAPLTSLRGSTLLPSGQEITRSLILRLNHLVESGIVADRIHVGVPLPATSEGAAA